jgi:sarcosine oxidase subunit gamma
MPADTSSTLAAPAAALSALRVRWSRQQAIVNFRGDPSDASLAQALSGAVGSGGLPWPTRPAECPTDGPHRVVWAGPDDWFVIAPAGSQEALMQALRAAAGSRHHAVTDVSSGYVVRMLAGAAARDVLAQGCPLDLHPRSFPVGQSAGTVFFKASVWMWLTGDEAFELLVRSSFVGYVEEMLRRCTLECGIAAA